MIDYIAVPAFLLY